MKHVVITGSARGLGLALAKRSLMLGCRVTISGRNAAALEAARAKLVESLPEHAHSLAAITCDVTSAEQVEALWAGARALAPVDLWINNAGVSGKLAPLWAQAAPELASVIDTNVRGALLGSFVAMRGMHAQGSGAIYNLIGFGSTGTMYFGALTYGASRYAVAYITRALAREARSTGVVVCSVDPGAVRTEMMEETWGEARNADPFLDAAIEALSLPPDEVAGLLVPRLLANRRSGALIRPWNPFKAWLRLLLIVPALLRGQSARR